MKNAENKLLGWLVSFSLMLSGCGLIINNTNDADLPFTVINVRPRLFDFDENVTVYRDSEIWDALWSDERYFLEPPPKINFEKNMVLRVPLGCVVANRPLSVYFLSVRRLDNPKRIEVAYKAVTPKRSWPGMGDLGCTYTSKLLVIPKSDSPVKIKKLKVDANE